MARERGIPVITNVELKHTMDVIMEDIIERLMKKMGEDMTSSSL